MTFTTEWNRARRVDPILRFMPKVNTDGPIPETRPDLGPCWLWTAALLNTGYGKFSPGPDRSRLAHRFSYEHHVGPIPHGFVIDHLCRVPPCVNPAHLEAVTISENLFRGAGSGLLNGMRRGCIHGHEYDEANTYRAPSGVRCRECARIRDRQRRRGSK